MRHPAFPLRAALGLTLALGCIVGVTGCSLHFARRGLVQMDDGHAVLVESTGRTWKVAGGGEGAVVAGLTDCEVQVQGTRWLGMVHVKDWTIEAGPHGGHPFVGRLGLYGSNWILDDRTTGRPLILDLRGHEALAEQAGKIVMIDGIVVGAQTVQVMQWRVVAN